MFWVWTYLCPTLLSALNVMTESPEYSEAVNRALYFQIRADSLRRLTETRVSALTDAPESQKAAMRIAIRDSDVQATATQKKADEWFARAGKFETIPVRVPSVKAETSREIVEPEITKSLVEPETKAGPEKSDTKDASAEGFAILARSPYSDSNPIPVDAPLPDGAVYKIQLGAFGKPVPPDAFKGLTPVSAERLSNGVTKYFTGLFRKYADADAALRKVREYGYKDAYIVAFYNKKTITPERAKQLENK